MHPVGIRRQPCWWWVDFMLIMFPLIYSCDFIVLIIKVGPCVKLSNVLLAGPGSSKLGLRTTAAIIFARLVLVPPVGLGIVMLADKLGFLPAGDKMFRFVLLLQHTMPTSVLAGIAQFSSLDTSLNKFLRTGTKILQNIDTYRFWRHFEQPRFSLTTKPFLGCWKLTQLIFLFSPNC